MDDFLWTATSAGEPVVQRLLDRFKIGRIESDTFRFCGREYVQSLDGTITINCRDNTRAIRPIDISKTEKGTTSVTNAQRTALRSVIGSLAWVARATRPDLAYRVNASRLRYKAKLPWNTGELAVVTFCDASFAGESGHKSQRGRFHYLTSAKTAADEDAVYHDMHLISYSSSTMKRVCRATSAKRTRCNTPLSMETESEPQCSRCKVSPHWEQVARRSMLHLQFTDCRSDIV